MSAFPPQSLHNGHSAFGQLRPKSSAVIDVFGCQQTFPFRLRNITGRAPEAVNPARVASLDTISRDRVWHPVGKEAQQFAESETPFVTTAPASDYTNEHRASAIVSILSSIMC